MFFGFFWRGGGYLGGWELTNTVLDPGFVERGGGGKAKGLEASEFCEFLRHFFLAILAVFI